MPNCCIGVDVIVGFPGESEEHFLSTYDFINSLDVSYLHVFPYSERNNTTAKKLPNTVSKSEKTDRAQRLRILSAKKKRHFYESQISKTMSVLWEEENHGGDLMQGFSENYIRFEAPYDSNKVNKIEQLIFKEIAVSGLASSRTQSVLHSN
jgi:threonylcarbamoyladenosine tRNA methylthiotransferase MtaB